MSRTQAERPLLEQRRGVIGSVGGDPEEEVSEPGRAAVVLAAVDGAFRAPAQG